MTIESLWGQSRLPFKLPRRKGIKEGEEYFGFCAIDGRLSSYILMSPYHRPGAQKAFATKKRTVRKTRNIKNAWAPDQKSKSRQSDRQTLKKPICRFHRDTNDLHVPKKLRDSLGPTTIESKRMCPEQFLWNHDPMLKGHLQISDEVAIGVVFHKLAAQYATKGVLREDGQMGVEGLVNLGITNTKALGLSHALKDASKNNLIAIKRTVTRMLRTAIRDKAIERLSEIESNEMWESQENETEVVLAEVEIIRRVYLSQLIREILGYQESLRYDTVLDCHLDRLLIQTLPGPKLRVIVRDLKSRRALPDLEEINRYIRGIQLPVYGVGVLLAALSHWENMPELELVLEFAFVTEDETLTFCFKPTDEEILQSLREVYRFLKEEAEAKQYKKDHGWQRMALDKYPATPGPYCKTCSAYKLCTATREKNPGKSWDFIDQILPSGKELTKGQKQIIWT